MADATYRMTNCTFLCYGSTPATTAADQISSAVSCSIDLIHSLHERRQRSIWYVRQKLKGGDPRHTNAKKSETALSRVPDYRTAELDLAFVVKIGRRFDWYSISIAEWKN